MPNEIRSIAKGTAHLDQKVVDVSSPTVGSVLRAASKMGLKVALIHQYLGMIDYEDAGDLFRDLSHGFPLVGDIPVSPVSPPAKVRTATLLLEDIGRGGRTGGQLLPPARYGALNGSIEAEKKVFSQTLGDIALGRMGFLVRPNSGAFPL